MHPTDVQYAVTLQMLWQSVVKIFLTNSRNLAPNSMLLVLLLTKWWALDDSIEVQLTPAA